MSRHSRTSAASAVLKLCRDTGRPLAHSDLEEMRNHIMNHPDIPEKSKFEIIDLVSVVVFRHEQYRSAFSELETVLGGLKTHERGVEHARAEVFNEDSTA